MAQRLRARFVGRADNRHYESYVSGESGPCTGKVRVVDQRIRRTPVPSSEPRSDLDDYAEDLAWDSRFIRFWAPQEVLDERDRLQAEAVFRYAIAVEGNAAHQPGTVPVMT
jgi:hypothetical protein